MGLDPGYENKGALGKNPLLPPPYSDAIAEGSHTPPSTDSSVRSDEMHGHDFAGRPGGSPQNATSQNLGGRREASEYEDRECRWSKKDIQRRHGAVGRLVMILIAMLTGVYFIPNAVRSIYGNKESSPYHGDEDSRHIQFPDNEKAPPASFHKDTATFAFTEPSEFYLVQLTQGGGSCLPNPFGHVRTRGEINVRPAAEHPDFKVRVELVAHASDPQLIGLESVEKTDSGLTIKTPDRFSKGKPGFSPCLSLHVTIWVSAGTVLQNLGIDTQSLSITFHPGLNYTVTHSTTLSTVAGPISMPASDPFNPLSTTRTREIIINSASGAVTGTYPLYDLLSITTLSGSISIALSPQKASPSYPKPASLILHTASASILVTTPSISSPSSIPFRNYTSSLTSASGSLSATLLHTTSTTLHTSSGRIRASIHPHGPPSSPSHLSSRSQSGSTAIRLHNSLSHPSSPLRALSASHHFISGSLELVYPGRWEGSIVGKTVSGRLGVHWEGVRIVKERNGGGFGRLVEAVRGEGEGKLLFEGVSGSAVLRGESTFEM